MQVSELVKLESQGSRACTDMHTPQVLLRIIALQKFFESFVSRGKVFVGLFLLLKPLKA